MRGAHLLKTRYLNFFEHRSPSYLKYFSGQYLRIFFWDKHKATTIKCCSMQAFPELCNVKLVVHKLTTRLPKVSMEINFRTIISTMEFLRIVDMYQTIWCHILEDRKLSTRHCGNLISRILLLFTTSYFFSSYLRTSKMMLALLQQ